MDFRLHCRAPVLAALLFALASPVAVAATVEVVKRPYCTVRLSGKIEEGDKQKLEAAVELAKKDETKRDNDLTNGETAVCLNSPGGSFSEALLILDYLSTSELGTMVDRGDACHEACAFAFMGGRFRYYHATTLPIRRLHVDAELGFRTPSFKAAEGAYDKAAVQQAYANGSRVISALVAKDLEFSTLGDRGRIVPRALMLEILGKEPEDPLMTETIDQAGRWGIELVGFRQPAELTRRVLLQACVNEGNWLGRNSGIEVSGENLDAAVQLSKSKARVRFDKLGPKRSDSCTVDVYRSPKSGLFIDAHFNTAGTKQYVPALGFLEEQVTGGGGDRGRVGESPGIKLWAIFPPDTQLRDIREK